MYSWNLRIWGEVSAPEYTAFFSISFLLYLNLFTILILVELATGFAIHKQINVIPLVLTLLGIAALNYFIFLQKGKYKKMVKQFGKENLTEKKRRFIWCLVYVIFSFAGFFGLVSILSPKP